MSFSALDHQCMAEALRLARTGQFTTQPNPCVGCVIERDGQVIGRGWHRRAGAEHAEIHALAEAGSSANGATAYVTLEPCSHHGRTAPCADALLDAGVRRVVVAAEDPNPLVNGAGLERLRAAGVDCSTGLMAAEAESLNAGFYQRMRTGRPRVRIKLAQGLDGRIALAGGASAWISSAPARADVQRWRARAGAVLSAYRTVAADDPSLNVRLEGVSRQPLRVILDSRFRTSPAARTLALEGEVVIMGRAGIEPPPALVATGATLVHLPGDAAGVDLGKALAWLADREVNDVHVEAGGSLCGALLQQGLADEVMLYLAPVMLGSDGVPGFAFNSPERMAERPEFIVLDRRQVGRDLRLRLQPQYRNT